MSLLATDLSHPLDRHFHHPLICHFWCVYFSELAEEDEGDDDQGGMSTDDSTESSAHSSRCGSPTFRSNGDKKKKKLKNKNLNPKLNYKCIGYWKENHGHPIFGVSVNHHLDASSPTVFATVGYNRVTIYEAMAGGIKLLQVKSKESHKP